MPDTYGVTHADIAAELPGYFPGGFSATSQPSDAQVTTAITTADTVVTLLVQDTVGTAPAVTDRAAAIAKRYIIEWVKAWVLRTALVGRDPAQVDLVAKPFADLAAQMRLVLIDLGAQAVGAGESAPRITVPYTTAQRDLVIDDIDIDAGSGLRGRF